MEKILDLRFIIGVFFTALGALLLVTGMGASGMNPSGIANSTLSISVGLVMGIFGLGMLIGSFRTKPA